MACACPNLTRLDSLRSSSWAMPDMMVRRSALSPPKVLIVAVLEKHADPGAQQLSGVLDGGQGVAGEAGDLLCDDEDEEPRLAVLHAVEVFPLIGSGGGRALVDVALHERPDRISKCFYVFRFLYYLIYYHITRRPIYYPL